MAELRSGRAFAAELREVLRISADDRGDTGRALYADLLKRALRDLAADPRRHGVRPVEGRPGAFSYPIRFSREPAPADLRVGWPRHVVFFRSVDTDAEGGDGGGDGGEIVQLLRVLHDQMLPETWLP